MTAGNNNDGRQYLKKCFTESPAFKKGQVRTELPSSVQAIKRVQKRI